MRFGVREEIGWMGLDGGSWGRCDEQDPLKAQARTDPIGTFRPTHQKKKKRFCEMRTGFRTFDSIVGHTCQSANQKISCNIKCYC